MPCRRRETQRNTRIVCCARRSRPPHSEITAGFFVVGRGIHVPEQPPCAIKPFPVRLVKNFRAQKCDTVRHFANAPFKRRTQRFGRVGSPARAQRLWPTRGMRQNDLRCASRGSRRHIFHPLRRQKRHVAAHNQVPVGPGSAAVSIFERGDDSPERSLPWPTILDNFHSERLVFPALCNDFCFLRDTLQKLDHARQHGLPAVLAARFTGHQSRVTLLPAVPCPAGESPIRVIFLAGSAGAARWWLQFAIRSSDAPTTVSSGTLLQTSASLPGNRVLQFRGPARRCSVCATGSHRAQLPPANRQRRFRRREKAPGFAPARSSTRARCPANRISRWQSLPRASIAPFAPAAHHAFAGKF